MSLKDIMTQRLRKSRIDMGYTLNDVGFKLNTDYHTISDYETGRYDVSLNDLLKFAELYGVSVNYLLGISKGKTDDTAIYDYTGLDREYIDKLHKLKVKNQITMLKRCIDDLSKDTEIVDTKNVESIIGVNIKQLRQEKGISVLRLSKALGISNSTMHAIERGERRVKLNVMLKLSKYFNKDMGWFSEIH